jgi:hypothetical protein
MLRSFATWIVETFIRDKIFAENMRESREKSFGEVMRVTTTRDEIVRSWYKEVWLLSES